MKVPRHIAVIMDGNRRWADEHKVPHISGHSAGVKALDSITEECARNGVRALTVYGFSVENWSRPRDAVELLFSLLRKTLKEYMAKVKKNNIRFNVIGRVNGLPDDLRSMLEKAVINTRKNSGMILTAALNYGGRQEIMDAVKLLMLEKGGVPQRHENLSENDLERFLYTAGLPEVDLLVRTSGEIRISNFLLWQSAYAEFYFTETLWPDFGPAELAKALEEYGRRQRRFGG